MYLNKYVLFFALWSSVKNWFVPELPKTMFEHWFFILASISFHVNFSLESLRLVPSRYQPGLQVILFYVGLVNVILRLKIIYLPEWERGSAKACSVQSTKKYWFVRFVWTRSNQVLCTADGWRSSHVLASARTCVDNPLLGYSMQQSIFIVSVLI